METVGSVTVVAFGIRKMSLIPTVPLRCISSAIVPNYIIFYHKVLGLPYSSSRRMREKIVKKTQFDIHLDSSFWNYSAGSLWMYVWLETAGPAPVTFHLAAKGNRGLQPFWLPTDLTLTHEVNAVCVCSECSYMWVPCWFYPMLLCVYKHVLQLKST